MGEITHSVVGRIAQIVRARGSNFVASLLRSLGNLTRRATGQRLVLIDDQDLLALLDYSSLKEDIEQHRIRCVRCDNEIDLENLAGILVQDGAFRPFCSSSECLSRGDVK